jgi:hypothetical protein
MKQKHSYRPALEGLEARWVPATIRLIGGNLFVSNQVGALTVATQATAGQVKVSDGAASAVFSGVGGLIAVTGTNKIDTITIDSTAKAFPGNVLINALNGGDVLSLTGDVGGSATVLGGFGDDKLTIAGAAKLGGTLTYNGGLGLNDLTLTADLQTGANLITSGLSKLDGAGALTVGGTASLVGNPAGATPLTVVPTGDVTVGGAINVSGGGGIDTVSLMGKLSVGGQMSVNLRGGGINTFVLDPTAGGSGVGGSLFFSGNGGSDVVVFGADSSVAGNTTLELGNGINTFVDTDTSLYGGNLTVNGGNGTNTVVAQGVVSGDFNNSLGNGDGNTTQFSGSVGGRFRYRLGNGALGTLNLFPAAAATIDIDAVFGTGDSTFNLGDGVNAVTLTGIVRGTGGSYTFNQNLLATLAPTLILINYP